ncbi:restriction endonuclease subunit S [Alloprevotella tannerae]|uniref:restriction endonuclease subunit S n=1 Tax=Alloprevotella tannerae TaxID=76122 RepID=UPI001EDA8A93|nr:restriction endonuclease subunit S [Alloprevotella tannerae]
MDTKKLRQKILDLAIHGKLVPQDPNDEPASVLLERIRAEKERLISEGKIKRSRKTVKTSDTHHYENDVPFDVPKGWVWTILGEIAESNIGLTYKPSDICNDGVPVYRSNNIQGVKIDTTDLVRVQTTILDKQFLKEGDLLICARNGSRRLVGKNAIIRKLTEKTAFGAFMAVCRSKYNPWLHLLLQTSYFDKYLDESNSTAINQVTQSMLLALNTPLPPLAEQQRIVAEIERWFALIDIIEQGKVNLQTAIKQMKSKILDLAIHGKLVPQDASDEPASELLKRINPKAQKPCDNGHYAQLPKGWSVCLLENIIEYEQPTDYIVSSTNYDDSYLTPVLTAGKSFIIGYTDEEEGLYSKLPCIIFDDFTTASKLVTFPFKVKSSAMKILQVNQNISIKYVAAFMSITQLIGDTHKRYWISEYSKLSIPIPPKEEQERIVVAIDNLFNALDAVKENL